MLQTLFLVHTSALTLTAPTVLLLMQNTQGLVFFIDSNDRDRFSEVS